jgi:hypothetical protein
MISVGLHVLDDVGDGVGLARAGDAQQGLLGDAPSKLLVSFAMASGWSPAGEYGETSSKRSLMVLPVPGKDKYTGQGVTAS